MQNERIAVIGLGYVGLPLAVALSRKSDTIGFDVSERRVEELRQGSDSTNEISSEELRSSSLQLSADPASIAGRTIYIVTVPTPIDEANRPDFTAILRACELVGAALAAGAIVVFESTVYPGDRGDLRPGAGTIVGPRCGVDFKLGYSPERINPGDKDHPLEKIVKVVAGQDEATLQRLSAVYGSIIEAGNPWRPVDQGGRGGQGDRKHPARREHRADERDFEDLRAGRNPVVRGACRCRDEVELPEILSRPGRRSLHRRRPLLPDREGGAARLSAGGHPVRSADQRQHGPMWPSNSSSGWRGTTFR